jgi:hypothetical protein
MAEESKPKTNPVAPKTADEPKKLVWPPTQTLEEKAGELPMQKRIINRDSKPKPKSDD